MIGTPIDQTLSSKEPMHLFSLGDPRQWYIPPSPPRVQVKLIHFCPGVEILQRPPFSGATTFSITTFSIKGLFVTLSIMTFCIHDTQHNSTRALMLSVIVMNVAFYLWLCWVPLCWVSLCWVSLCWMLLCWVSWHLFVHSLESFRSTMRLFHPLNCLVATRNLWLIL